MQVKDLLKAMFKSREASLVVVAVFTFGTAYFSYLSSSNNLELTQQLETFDVRVRALEEFRQEDHTSAGNNEDAIIVIETKLNRIEQDISEIKTDLKILIAQ